VLDWPNLNTRQLEAVAKAIAAHWILKINQSIVPSASLLLRRERCASSCTEIGENFFGFSVLARNLVGFLDRFIIACRYGSICDNVCGVGSSRKPYRRLLTLRNSFKYTGSSGL
jgi:hypothetical protein